MCYKDAVKASTSHASLAAKTLAPQMTQLLAEVCAFEEDTVDFACFTLGNNLLRCCVRLAVECWLARCQL